MCLSVRQGFSTSDGFLSSAEYSIWASTMKLSEDEAHPTLRDSHFLSLPSDPPPQVSPRGHQPPHVPIGCHGRVLMMLRHGCAQKESRCRNPGPLPRELSLSEWRHWQHRALPTHAVDHSLRCQHFVKVMELIDGMREENEVRTDDRASCCVTRQIAKAQRKHEKSQDFVFTQKKRGAEFYKLRWLC